MSRIKPLTVEDLSADMQQAMGYAQELMGFTPNDVLAMARWPEFLNAVKVLIDVVYSAKETDDILKRMVATVVSGAAGCRYCQAHTAHGAVKMVGADAEKITQVWEFESSDLFSDAERAALRLAMAAGSQPNATTDEHFTEVEKHFSGQQIMEIMGIISVFGLLNRWNDTAATQLEDAPLNFAKTNLRESDWEPGHHVKG